MPSASAYAGVAQGLNAVAADIQSRPYREAQRAEATAKQKLAETKLQEFQQQAPTRQAEGDLALQQAQSDLRRLHGQNAKNQLYSAFDRYEADGDVRHLNNFQQDMQQNPVGSRMFGAVSRFDPITKSPEVDRMLAAEGITDLEGAYASPQVRKAYVLATKPDGTQMLVNLRKAQAGTQYTRYSKGVDLAEQVKEANILAQLRGGASAQKVAQTEAAVQSYMEANDVPYHEAFQAIREMEAGTKRSSADMQGINEMMEASPDLTFEQATEQWFKSKGKRGGTPTAKQKEAGSIEAIRTELDTLREDPEAMSKPAVRRQIERKVHQLEDLRDFKFSNEEKRQVREFRSLMDLASTVSDELTPRETGIYDSTLSNFKKYMFSEIGGSEGTAAYETFRNSLRLAMSGQSVTEQEAKNFNKAAGTLGQKFKPAMTRFLTQVRTIKSKLEAVRDFGDTDITEFYLGEDIDKVDDVIRSIEERIGLVDATGAQDKAWVTSDAPVTPVEPEVNPERPSLDSLIPGANP